MAYADFVTAMMALFMVLWISSQDQKILIATSQYFQNPFRSPLNATSGVMPFNSNKTTQSQGKDQGDAKEVSRNKQMDVTFLNSVAADFYRLLHLDENLADRPIEVQVTTDGLRVTLFDRSARPLFVNGSAEFTEWGKFAMQNLAWTIDRHSFRVNIDGHTRTEPPKGRVDYTNWELSADRANAARRSLVYYAVDPESIERITGYANTRPMEGYAPDAESNQRITLSLTLTAKHRFRDSSSQDQPVTGDAGKGRRPMKPFLQGKKSIPEFALRAPSVGMRNVTTANANETSQPVENRSANVEVVKQGDKVVRLIITCACGEKIEVNCLYPPGV